MIHTLFVRKDFTNIFRALMTLGYISFYIIGSKLKKIDLQIVLGVNLTQTLKNTINKDNF